MSRRRLGVVLVVGLVSWFGFGWLGVLLYSTSPRTAAFDLDLLIDAGRAVAAGRTPYDAQLLYGVAPAAEGLFYSYPPVVAQAMTAVARLPSLVIFLVWDLAAVTGLLVIADRIRQVLAPAMSRASVLLPLLAVVPMLFPLAVGLLFGNVDVFFPLLYGLMLLAMLERPPGARVLGGVAAAAAAVAKLHPSSIALWLALRSRSGGPARTVLAAAIVATTVVVAVSLIVWGLQPWLDYATVVRTGSGAELVDPRNAGPAAQIALALQGAGRSGEALARTLHVVVAIIAILATALAAIFVLDPVESLAWGAAASLVVLPVTWYHYPSALIPFGLAALLRTAGTPKAAMVRVLVGGSAVVAVIAIAWLPVLYVAVALLLAGVHASRSERAAVSEPSRSLAARRA